MADKLSVAIVPSEEGSGPALTCVIDVHDTSLLSHSARLELVQRVKVHDSRGIHQEKTVWSSELSLDSRRLRRAIDAGNLGAYTYRGRMIDLELQIRVVVDDGILFDTTVTETVERALGGKPSVSNDSKQLIEPKDAFQFFANLKAIRARDQFLVLLLSVVAAVLIAANTLVGVHDQFSPEGRTYLYSHRDSDGDSSSPLVNSLTGSGALGALVWFAMRKRLRRYMSFHLTSFSSAIRRGDQFQVSQLCAGAPRIDLERVTLRVVACNMEKGQYKRGSGTNERTVSFSEPARAVLLYEKEVARIEAGSLVQFFFPETITFDPMFTTLYPPIRLGSSHGLAVHWEIQLLHPEFVDQELVGPSSGLVFEDFLEA